MSVVEVTRLPAPQWRLRLVGDGSPCQRRSFVRADASLPVRLRVGRDEWEVTVLDVSEGGLRCSTDQPLPLSGGTSVEVRLELDDTLRLDLTAEVVRARRKDPALPLDLGLRFTDLPITDADRLRRWIFAELRRRRSGAA